MIWIVKGIKMYGSTLKKKTSWNNKRQMIRYYVPMPISNDPSSTSTLFFASPMLTTWRRLKATILSSFFITYSHIQNQTTDKRIKIFHFLSRENKNPRTLWLRQLMISWYKNKNKNAKQIHQFHDKPTLPTPSEWTKCIKSPSSYKSFAPSGLVRRDKKELPADLLPTQIKKILQPKNWDCIKCGHDEIEKLQHLDFAVRDQLNL